MPNMTPGRTKAISALHGLAILRASLKESHKKVRVSLVHFGFNAFPILLMFCGFS